MPAGDDRRLRPPPGAWEPGRQAVVRLVRPVEEFLRTEVAGAVALLVAAAVALGWANSPWRHHYAALWAYELRLGIGPFDVVWPLRAVVDDGLMTLFFFVVGLEIRREMHRGELSAPRRAALPLAAALGGMIAPALIYLAINRGTAHASGWGVPMATDIAFAVGVLTLLGRRAPPALRILLLALAIIDDVGAILVIGLFYSGSFAPIGLAIAAGGVALVLGLQRLGVRRTLPYVLPASIVWYGCHRAGIHPTLAGVVVGLLTPPVAWYGTPGLIEVATRTVGDIERASDPHAVAEHLDALDAARREAVAPVDRLQHQLHPWVALLVMPLFALANAGVTVAEIDPSAVPWRLVAGVVFGLVVGKPLGILAGSWVSTRLGIAAMPRGLGWAGIAVVGMVGGIGFTMSLFMAELAFHDPRDHDFARLSILLASTAAAILGAAFGRSVLPARSAIGTAPSESDAEGSTAA